MRDDRSADIDFLCIGAQKAATSWLWINLRNHPDVWLPPRKELHYFDRSLKYPSPSHLADDDASSRILSDEKHNVLFRSLVRKELSRAFRSNDPSDIQWHLRYFFGNCSDDWYRSLFDGSGAKLKGEITPSYSILDDGDVRGIKSLFPNLKIMLILRNPIERAWSHIRFLMKNKQIGDASNRAEIRKIIESPLVSSRGNYPEILRVWNSHFPATRLFVGYYEDIQEDPYAYLGQAFEFLGLENSVSAAHVVQRVNTSPVMDMPTDIRTYLCRKYLTDLEKLAELPSPHTGKWLSDCRRILDLDS